MKNFDNLNILEDRLSGTALVEAAAGTGKTYAIVGLYLRLVAEKGLDVRDILAVTFTEAATSELCEKIRTGLRRAASVFKSGKKCGDPLIDGLFEKMGQDREVCARRFERALASFDDAAVFTIHGFCNRIICEYAFESGILFGSRLVTDQEDLKRTVAEDFWRINIYNTSLLFADYITNTAGMSPQTLVGILDRWGAKPGIRIVPDPCEEIETGRTERDLLKSYNLMCEQWKEYRDEICQILKGDKALNRNRYRSDYVDGWIGLMDGYVQEGLPSTRLFNRFEKFTQGSLNEATKNGCEPPSHRFFETCQKHLELAQELDALFARRVAVLKSRFLRFAQTELKKRKRSLNVLYFDDLVLDLHEMLSSPRGGALAKRIAERYKAALIDEFQDTDPIQYEIFSSIFEGKVPFFMIGDPKQSIYAFRGADIFAYLEAVPKADATYTLGENWRSEKELVESVNALFGSMVQPFGDVRIPFRAVKPAATAAIHPLSVSGKKWSRLCFRVFEEDSFGCPGNKERWRRIVAQDTAAQVARLVEMGRRGEALIGERPLSESDIAVLVYKHDQAALVHECLSSLKVHATIVKTDDLFDTHEALEMELFVWAVAFAHDAGLVKAACATDMLGYDFRSIERIGASEGGAYDDTTERFAAYRDRWRRKGFMSMFRHAAREERMLEKLAAFPDGERRCTNVSHLAEVLHAASLEWELGPERLARWFSRQRRSGSKVEERQLRLESDDSAVKIVTIHRSKGLEYPVVFCPFLWDHSTRQNDEFAFHDKDGKLTLVLCKGDERGRQWEDWEEQREREEYAEKVRLLYVALTRAKNACYAPVVLSYADGSPIGGIIKGDDPQADVHDRLKALSSETGGSLVIEEAKPSDLDVAPLEPFEAGQADTLESRVFTGAIPSDWKVASFSSLRKAGPIDDMEHAVSDEVGADEPTLPEGIVDFPAGARSGLFLHELMEHLDFRMAHDTAYLEGLVSEGLDRYGFSKDWLGPVCEMVRKVVSTPLPLVGGYGSIKLSDVAIEDRVNEMEFFFPLKRITPSVLSDLYAGANIAAGGGGFPERVGRLDFSPARGFVHGFIDMVFTSGGRYFVADWKSNMLGATLEAYHAKRLVAVMEREYYILQAHIYAVALDRFLETRLPGYDYERDFGGIYYLFLRGMDPGAGEEYGIYYEKPSREFMERFSGALVETGGGK